MLLAAVDEPHDEHPDAGVVLSRAKFWSRRGWGLRGWILSGLLLIPLSWLALTLTAWRTPPPGLAASVQAGLVLDHAIGAPSPPGGALDAALDPAARAAERGLSPSGPFTVDWTGHLVVRQAGTHHLRVRVDDGVAVWVGGVLVLDRLGHVGELQVSVPLQLERGLTPVRVRYVQHGGDAVLRLSWATPLAREAFAAVPTVGPVAGPDAFTWLERSHRWPRLLAAAWSVWLLLGIVRLLLEVTTSVADLPVAATLGRANIVALATVVLPLMLLHLDVGAQPWRSWMADEVLPKHVVDAWTSRFDHGWYYLYPPLHFYLLAVVNAPFVLADGAGWLSFEDPAVHTVMHVMDRAVSGGLAWLTLLAAGLLAALTIGRTAALLVPWVLTGTPLFVFYGRTTNVDMAYTFWAIAGAVAFVRAASRRRLRDHTSLGLCAAAAVATKDQAYGFFVVPAAALLLLAWRDAGHAASGRQRALGTVLDRRLWAGALSFLAVYGLLLGVPWNPEGVRAHFALVTGAGSAPFRMFPTSPGGFEGLAATTIAVTWQALGPVVTMLILAGVVRMRLHPTPPLLPIALLVPAGYAITFIGVVGYVYDRFLLGPAVFLALVAAWGLDWLVRAAPGRVPRVVLTAGVVAVLLAPAVILIAGIANDSRTVAERWMRDALVDDPLVLGAGSELYLPNLAPYQNRVERRTSLANLLAWDADVIVLYEDWFGRPGEPSREMVRHTLESAGYQEQFAVRPPAPPTGWAPDLLSGLHIDSVFSNVGKVAPPLSIWRRNRGGAAPAAKGS